jgi:Lrp/AsnC family leucine-responsive transcriptional regulator
MERIDATDAKILELLQAEGRMKRNEIAEEVGMSLPSVSERIRKLEERGIITGYHAVVDAKRLQLDITAFVRVMVDRSRFFEDFVERAVALTEVQEVHSITGDGSHILRVCTRNTASLERLLSRIQAWPGVHGTMTSIVLTSFKDTRALRVEPMQLLEDVAV